MTEKIQAEDIKTDSKERSINLHDLSVRAE